MTEPAWHPDPTGRNHYRWWDGTQWTDSVSNNGQVGVDPVQAAAPVQPQPVQPQPAPAPQPVQPQTPMAQPPSVGAGPPAGAFQASPAPAAPKKNLLKIIVPVAAAVAVGVVLFVVLGGGDDGGGGKFGVIDTELPRRDSVVSFEYKLSKGDVIRFRAEPDEDLDLQVSILADQATARRYGAEVEDVLADVITDFEEFLTDAEDLFSDSDLGNLASFVALQTAENGFEGEAESDFFVAFVDGTYTLTLTSDDAGSRGKVRLIVEKFSKKIPIDTFDAFSDFDEFFSDEDAFFSDDDFFSSGGTFTP